MIVWRRILGDKVRQHRDVIAVLRQTVHYGIERVIVAAAIVRKDAQNAIAMCNMNGCCGDSEEEQKISDQRPHFVAAQLVYVSTNHFVCVSGHANVNNDDATTPLVGVCNVWHDDAADDHTQSFI